MRSHAGAAGGGGPAVQSPLLTQSSCPSGWAGEASPGTQPLAVSPREPAQGEGLQQVGDRVDVVRRASAQPRQARLETSSVQVLLWGVCTLE